MEILDRFRLDGKVALVPGGGGALGAGSGHMVSSGGGGGARLFEAQDYPRKEWDWIYELTVRAALLPTQAAVRAMIARGQGGRVINISSVRGLLGINAGY